jgi:hypothetical protein
MANKEEIDRQKKDKKREISRISYHKNREENLKKYKIYRIKNKEAISKRRKIVNATPEAKLKKCLYRSRIKKTDHLFNIKNRTRSLISTSFARKGYCKNTTTYNLLGCDWNTLKSHMENQFTKGMSWDVFNKIHIDHIIPLFTAKTEEDVIKLCHYTNLQPLWAIDNLRKSNKII